MTGQGHSEEGFTGNQVRTRCRSALRIEQDRSRGPNYDYGFCVGFIVGVLDLGSWLDNQYEFCRPDDKTVEQGARVLLKYMDAHPESTHEKATTLAVAAFRTAWPCRK
jgi:hypothetical protein